MTTPNAFNKHSQIPERAVNSVAVFCGSNFGNNPIYREHAEAIGTFLGKNGYTLYFGAGNLGLMGVVSKAALDAGGHVVGVTLPHLAHEIVFKDHPNFEVITVNDVDERKAFFPRNVDMAISLAGGMGTLAEDSVFADANYMRGYRTPPENAKPHFLMNSNGYWQHLILQQEHWVQEGFANPNVFDLQKFFNTPEELSQAILDIKEEDLKPIAYVGNSIPRPDELKQKLG